MIQKVENIMLGVETD